MADREARRNPRLRLACSRCQRRKIRCDGQLPACNNCKKASAVCSDGESLRLRDVARDASTTVLKLKRRIECLESIIKERLPDVDLSQVADFDLSVPESLERDVSEPISGRVEESVLSTEPAHRGQNTADLPSVAQDSTSAHEIGLVSVGTNSDQRYVGPSSGYFLARMLLNVSPHRKERAFPRGSIESGYTKTSLIGELVEAAQGALPLPKKEHAVHLAYVYFDILHAQYPVLHEPSFMQTLDHIYQSENLNKDPYSAFQVYMVLALGSTILSRRARGHVPGESYCLSALQYFDQLNVENSLLGTQCLLLLLIFTIHSPYMKLNVWYLNYQCIAALLDLGLQRNTTTSSGISLVNQELRTRIFWVIFTLDRTIATMMGRPIGVRDEACELRLPQNLDDRVLAGLVSEDSINPNPISSITFSIHLFKLAKINSEIKYVANSIVREAPSYAYPAVLDIQDWHQGMLNRLDQWASDIPQGGNRYLYIRSICNLRYHSVRMLLLRPSPAIPKPSIESLLKCHDSASQTIRLFDELYKQDMLVHSWMTFHSLIFSTISLLYCIRAVPEIARSTEADVLMEYLGISLSILSATGEHWSGAKKCRFILDELGRSTLRWIKDLARPGPLSNDTKSGPSQPQRSHVGNGSGLSNIVSGNTIALPGSVDQYLPGFEQGHMDSNFHNIGINIPLGNDIWVGSLPNQFDFGGSHDIDSIMRNMFDGFIPYTQEFPHAPLPGGFDS
ncbi:fungal-specific transcription factor domain-containing protein [Dendryphion nanum]|uniref:Fungal-specific transcription factor domain-containing protein n=1 Tax=Dendryphion nanum TaxID=256645 RepID=A0A9P9DH19_9PLEO|nr:fungal-specific transcription factor domain-containing protein [Dendryphion nanum]